MQVTVSRVSPVEISLRVALPKDRVSSALERAYDELGRQAQIRGFRKGKVPRPLLRQYFGSRVTNDVFRKLVDETLPGAMRDQRIDPVATPQVEPDADLEGAVDWSYTAHLEVRPEIANLDLSTLTLTRKVYTVDDHDVQHVLDARREQNHTLRTPEPARPAVATDSVTIDLDMTVDGVIRPEFGTRGRTVSVGGSGLMPEIDTTLVGMSTGETRTVEVTFPADHRQKDVAGKTVGVAITVTALQEKVLPDFDDEFAKDLGSDSLDALKASIRADLEKRFQEQSEEELRSDAIDALVKANPLAVPPSMVENVLGQLRQEVSRRFAMQGQSVPAEITAGLRADAEERVRAGLLLNELARLNNLVISEDDLNARLEEMAKETGKAVQKLRVEYRDQRKRDMLFANVMETKVMVLLISKATITDQSTPTHSHDEHGHEAETPEAVSEHKE